MPARNIYYNSLNWGQGHHGSSNLIENYQFANFHSHRADFQFRRFCSDCHLWKHLSKTRHTQKPWHWTDCYHQKTHFQLWIWIQGYFYQLEDSNPQSKWRDIPLENSHWSPGHPDSTTILLRVISWGTSRFITSLPGDIYTNCWFLQLALT